MKKLLVAAALGVALVGVRPSESWAFGNPQSSQGAPCSWLQGKAIQFRWYKHFNGPLYNYGPYQGQGYYWMFVANRWCGVYTPALPVSAYGGYSVAPWSHFDNLPFPPTPAGGVGWVPTAHPPVVHGPAGVPPHADAGEASPFLPAQPTESPTTSYYGGPASEFFRPFKADK